MIAYFKIDGLGDDAVKFQEEEKGSSAQSSVHSFPKNNRGNREEGEGGGFTVTANHHLPCHHILIGCLM